MLTSTKKKTDQEQEQENIRDKMQVQDFMPGWAKEENCFMEAGTLIDVNTGKMTDRHWPRDKPIEQLVYEQWLDKTINHLTGHWNPKRDKEGNVIKGTGSGGKYLISVIYRINVDKQEFLLTKGFLKGFDVAGSEVVHWITYPERWTRTLFNYRRYFDDKTQSFQSQLLGPSGTETVYNLPFSPPNVDKLYEQTDKDNVQFVVKDQMRGESVEVNSSSSSLEGTSSLERTLQLFKEKSFEYLFSADYKPPAVKEQERQKAIMQGLIPPSSNSFQPPKEARTKIRGI